LCYSKKVTPRVWERIDLQFMEDNKYTSGYVHNITHRIKGSSQDILVEVHPFEDEFHRWKRMQEDYENWQQIRRLSQTHS